MKEVKEPEIKLFGRKIVLPDGGGGDTSGDKSGGGGGGDCDLYLEVSGGEEEGERADGEKQLPAEEEQVAELSETKMQENDQNPGAAAEESQSQNPTLSSELDESPKSPSIDEDTTSENNTKSSENDQSDAANGQQKTLKKPDKILPCPRCNSMDTKFCYYNNYNVNQPRHFCKSCQRYWTAGGTMRNVPVGAGRRKNKNSGSHCHHISISEALQAARTDSPNGFHHHPAFKTNGTVLSFGPDSPVCESMASALNLAEKRAPNGARNGYYSMDNGGSVSCKKGENKDDSSIESSVTTSSSMPEGGQNGPQQAVMPNMNGFPYPVPCIPGVAWPFPWNSALPLPAICPPGYPMPFYPAPPYWNCGVPNAWNVPWVSAPSSTANQKATTGAGPNSPLGKHSRNGELLKPNGSELGQEQPEPKSSESSIVVPKTLRMDDPEEAAKSSIWETLGIKYDSVRREGLFKAFQPKGDQKKPMVLASPVLQANPAALSRSISFQERA